MAPAAAIIESVSLGPTCALLAMEPWRRTRKRGPRLIGSCGPSAGVNRPGVDGGSVY